MTECPNLTTLVSFHEKALPEAQAREVETHVSGCGACQQRLSRLEHLEGDAPGAATEHGHRRPSRSTGSLSRAMRRVSRWLDRRRDARLRDRLLHEERRRRRHRSRRGRRDWGLAVPWSRASSWRAPIVAAAIAVLAFGIGLQMTADQEGLAPSNVPHVDTTGELGPAGGESDPAAEQREASTVGNHVEPKADGEQAPPAAAGMEVEELGPAARDDTTGAPPKIVDEPTATGGPSEAEGAAGAASNGASPGRNTAPHEKEVPTGEGQPAPAPDRSKDETSTDRAPERLAFDMRSSGSESHDFGKEVVPAREQTPAGKPDDEKPVAAEKAQAPAEEKAAPPAAEKAQAAEREEPKQAPSAKAPAEPPATTNATPERKEEAPAEKPDAIAAPPSAAAERAAEAPPAPAPPDRAKAGEPEIPDDEVGGIFDLEREGGTDARAAAEPEPERPPDRAAKTERRARPEKRTGAPEIVEKGAGERPAPRTGGLLGLVAPEEPRETPSGPVVAGGITVVSALNSGRRWRVGDSGAIAASVDGGQTWFSQESGVPSQLLAGSAPSNTVAWIVGHGGTVLRTVDGGETWEKVSFPDGSDLVGISAKGAAIATVTTDSGRIFTTRNGGRTWKEDASSS